MKSDRIGIVSSVVCLVHCASIPVLMSAATHWDTYLHRLLDSEWIHYAFLLVALSAVYFSTRHARLPKLRFLLWIFFGIFGLGIFASENFPVAKALVYLGSIGLVVGHLLNLRFRNQGQGHSKRALAS